MNASDAAVDSAMDDTVEELKREACLQDRHWYIFFLTSTGTMLTAALLVLLFRVAAAPFLTKKDTSRTNDVIIEPTMYSIVQNWAEDLISGNNSTGRFLVVFSFICSVAALVIYIIDTFNYDEEACISWKESTTVQLDFGLAVFFAIYYFFRFLAAEDKLTFVFSMESLVDYFTVPTVFLSVYMDRMWLGLRFLRSLIILNLSDVLVYVRLIETTSSIRLIKLITVFISLILTSAGICHLLENSGDPWKNFQNPHDPYLSYGDCIYFMFVTMSTVGYGDIYCQTDLGKVFIVFYMLGALAIFTNSVVEIAQLVGSRPKYAGDYVPNGRQFIIVCGNIKYETVQTFLSDFFHPARDDVEVEVVFLNKEEPSLDFEGLLKREHNRVDYFKGSLLSAFDLQRVRADKAAACLVLADKFCADPDAEDAANIMRVISLKNFCEDTRVIIQLMQYHNKGYLLNIPGWDWRRDDQAVCLNELKLGFLAQSCLAPGFSTLVSNLIITTMPAKDEAIVGNKRKTVRPDWKKDYLKGCNKFIMAETLSPTFVGMNFREVAEICYTKLNLLLLAIEARKHEGGDIFINPREKILNPNAIGLFITESAEATKKAWFYCRKCHENIKTEKMVAKCGCLRTTVRFQKDSNKSVRIKKKKKMADDYLKEQVQIYKEEDKVQKRLSQLTDLEAAESGKSNIRKGARERAKKIKCDSRDGLEQANMKYDSTGMFHWCPSRPIDHSLMDRQEAAMTVLQDHVIVAVFACPDSPLIGLRNLVMPLRASNIRYKDLVQVVILGCLDYLKREWLMLKNLPKISILNGSPLSRADLRAVKIDMCRTCIVLSAKVPSRLEPVLADKEVLLTALNIKAMAFSNVESDIEEENQDQQQQQQRQPALVVNIKNGTTVQSLDLDKRDSIMGDLMSNVTDTKKRADGECVPVIVDLAFAANVRFLDEHELHLSEVDLYKTLPFASGQAVARGILDSLVSTTYFNASALRLIRLWVTGGATIELELALAEGAGLRGGYSTLESLRRRNRFRVEKLPLSNSVFSYIGEGSYSFGHLFSKAIMTYGMLCIGIFRKLSQEAQDHHLRVVITAPDKDMPLQEDDIAYMLVQYHEDADQDDMEFQYPDSIALAMADSSKQRVKPPDHH